MCIDGLFFSVIWLSEDRVLTFSFRTIQLIQIIYDDADEYDAEENDAVE